MAVLPVQKLVVLYLTFFQPSFCEIKLNIHHGNGHMCIASSQSLHVDFGNGPAQQCGVTNVTPKAKDQGIYGSVYCVCEKSVRLKLVEVCCFFLWNLMFSSVHNMRVDCHRMILRRIPVRAVHMLLNIT